MANITKSIVSGRRQELIAAAASATERLARESPVGTAGTAVAGGADEVSAAWADCHP